MFPLKHFYLSCITIPVIVLIARNHEVHRLSLKEMNNDSCTHIHINSLFFLYMNQIKLAWDF
jgi:hypothetical protein